MPEDRPRSMEPPGATPEGSIDLPSTFEPAFRAVQELFQARLHEARSRIDRMTDGWEDADRRCTAAIADHSGRKKRLYVSVGLIRPTNGPCMDRSGLLDLMDRIGTPETRALATDLRLEDEWARRDEKPDEAFDGQDEQVLWTADEQVLNAEGVFEPEARRQMLGEWRELRARAEKLNSLRGRITTEMRRMILFSMRERDLKELDDLYEKHKRYLAMPATNAESPRRNDRRGSGPQGRALRLAELSGRIMELLAGMGTVRSGPEEFKKEAARRMCADIEEVISRMDAICSETAALQ